MTPFQVCWEVLFFEADIMIMKKEGRDESKQVNSPKKRGLHSLSYVGRNRKKFPPGTKPNWRFFLRDSEIESYARQMAEEASVSLAPDLCFKRRRLIFVNLNIVLEEYLSVVIFDIIAILNLSFYFVVRFAFYFTSTLLCSFMLPYKVQWFNFRVLLTWARLLEFNFLTPIKSGFHQKTPRCTKLPLEMAHRI